MLARPPVPVNSAFMERSTRRSCGPIHGGSFVHAVYSRKGASSRLIRDCHDRRQMRLSRVPVPSLCRRDLVYDPGGLRHGLPKRRADTAFQRSDAVRVRLGEEQAFHPQLILSGPRLSSNFRGSIQTPPTCFPRLQTIVSSGPRVPLPGWWLAFAHVRTFTSWMTTIDFIEAANLEFQQLPI